MRSSRLPRPLLHADMTPLVNIALLLIVFFVWMKQLQRPVAMTLYGPVTCRKYVDGPEPVAITNSLYLLGNNRIGLLTYLPDLKRMDLVEIELSTDRLRQQLALTAQKPHPTVAIVPTPNATVKNLVDVLDELRINGHIQFSISYAMRPVERRLLADYQRYRQGNPHHPLSMPIVFR